MERIQAFQFDLPLLVSQTELSPWICQVEVIVDSDFIVFLNGLQCNYATSVAVDVRLPHAVGTTGMVYPGNLEVQVLAGLVGHSVG